MDCLYLMNLGWFFASLFGYIFFGPQISFHFELLESYHLGATNPTLVLCSPTSCWILGIPGLIVKEPKRRYGDTEKFSLVLLWDSNEQQLAFMTLGAMGPREDYPFLLSATFWWLGDFCAKAASISAEGNKSWVPVFFFSKSDYCHSKGSGPSGRSTARVNGRSKKMFIF